MSERQKVAEMTKILVNMFPDSKKTIWKKKNIILNITIILFLNGKKML